MRSSMQNFQYVVKGNTGIDPAVQWKESVLVYDETDFPSSSQHRGSTRQGFTKHLLVSVGFFFCFARAALGLILHNLCSGGHVT